LRIIGVRSGAPTPFDGMFLKEYDPDRPGVAPDGSSMSFHLVCTANPAEAMTFRDAAEHHDTWVRVSRRHRVRPDGKLNRPLTAFTVRSEPIDASDADPAGDAGDSVSAAVTGDSVLVADASYAPDVFGSAALFSQSGYDNPLTRDLKLKLARSR
jgi:hypothetical protein